MDVGSINRIIADLGSSGLLRASRSGSAAASPDIAETKSGPRSKVDPRGVVAEISPRGIELAEELSKAAGDTPPHEPGKVGDSTTREEEDQIRELKKRDREVKTHEQAHLSAAGTAARGGASFSYTTGPDGQQYATGGEVSIDLSAEPGAPEKTIQKMRQVRAAAMAPADPSAQDHQVAAEANQISNEARAEIRKETQAEANEEESPGRDDFASQIDRAYAASSGQGAEMEQRISIAV